MSDDTGFEALFASEAALRHRFEQGLEQLLDVGSMNLFILVEKLSETLPGIRVGYNALGAFASVNHLHLQLFVREQPLPVRRTILSAAGYSMIHRLPGGILHNCMSVMKRTICYTPRAACIACHVGSRVRSNCLTGQMDFPGTNCAALDKMGIAVDLACARQ